MCVQDTHSLTTKTSYQHIHTGSQSSDTEHRHAQKKGNKNLTSALKQSKFVETNILLRVWEKEKAK